MTYRQRIRQARAQRDTHITRTLDMLEAMLDKAARETMDEGELKHYTERLMDIRSGLMFEIVKRAG